MSDDIIDLGAFLERRAAEEETPPGTMALWGADGERSRFALPLWRIVHVAKADRAVIFWRESGAPGAPTPFIVLDVGRDPARLDLVPSQTDFGDPDGSQLRDLGSDGVLVHLGTSGNRAWGLLADGRPPESELDTRSREDVLFLAGECAGLLFLRSLADDVVD